MTINCSLALATTQIPTFQQSYPFSSPVPKATVTFLSCVFHLQPDSNTAEKRLKPGYGFVDITLPGSLFVLSVAVSPDSIYQHTLQTAKQVIQDKIQVVSRSFS